MFMNMVSEEVIVWGVVSVIITMVVSACLIYWFLVNYQRQISRRNSRQRQIIRRRLRSDRLRREAQQEQNIFNISGRVPSTTPYPHAYLSIEHITISNELNKPPKYDDLPPSYDEAIKLALAQSNSLQSLRVEHARIHEDPSSTSSATTVVTAITDRTTE